MAGDSVLAVFETAASALDAALAVQMRLNAEAAETTAERRVCYRIGVHLGNIIEKPDGTVYGDGVNMAARLQALADPGCVCVSVGVRGAVGDRVACSFEDLGTQQVKNISRPVHAFRVDPASLKKPAEHHATTVTATDQVRGATNVPHEVDPLIGRKEDIAAVRRLLVEHRLVTVTGTGGIGKTRLAQAVTRSVVHSFAHGAWWVDLSAFADPVAIVPAIAAAASLWLGAGESAVHLSRLLVARDMLIILDNCEHLAVDVAAVAQAILTTASGIRLLATSQQPLQVRGEHLYRLETLAVPARGTKLNEARGFSALALLEQRASTVDRHFALTEATLDSAIELCRQLDGIALAIEMAAARLPALGVVALRSQLARLRTASQVAPARQRTLRATIEWSHGLLTAEEQAVLRRLAVFVGSFRLDAAQRVAATDGLDASVVTEALGGLVDKSLVQVELAEPLRYRLLETMRTYAAERLSSAGEVETALQRHGLAMAALAGQADEIIVTTPQTQWQQTYAADYGDMHAAFERACGRSDPEVAAATGEMLWTLDHLNGRMAAARRRTHAAHALLAGASPLAQARLWNCIATWCGTASAPVPAIEAARQRVAAWERVGDSWQRYWAMSRLAAALARSGDLMSADKVLAEMRAIENPAWPLRRRFHTVWVSSMLSLYRGDAAALESSSGVELAMADRIGHERARAMANDNFTRAALLAGDAVKAVACGRESVQAWRQLGAATDLALALADLCAGHLLAEDASSSASSAMEALPLLIDNDCSGFLFDALSLLAVRTAESETGAMLRGCADAWYAKLEMVRTPIEVRMGRLAKAEVDGRLGPTRSEELRVQGGALPLAEAEALAHRVLTRAVKVAGDRLSSPRSRHS
jgi:predicted ATPase